MKHIEYRPRVFFAENGNEYIVKRIQEVGIGRMWSRDTPRLYPGEIWAFDNGAYSAFIKDEPFPELQFLRRLDRALDMGVPYLAVTPDIVCGGMKSLDFSLHWIERLPQEWPWYLAVQDGMKIESVRNVIDKFQGIFLGGSNDFKSTASQWNRLGLPVHYGRCGTRRKLRHAIEVGVDSLDSSTPIQNGIQSFELFLGCYQYGDPQGWLFDE